jgi:hypothetical protein
MHAAQLLLSRAAAPLLLLAKRQQHLCLGACRCCSLLGFPPRLRPGRKTKDASRSVTCAAACLGCVSMWRCSGLMPRAALCLEGRWARCRRQPTAIHPRGRATTAAPGRIAPSEGENAARCSGHGPPAQADGRGPPPAADPARHVVLCGHRSVFSSPPGRRMFRLLTFFHEPSALPRAARVLQHAVCRLPASVIV